MERKKEMSPWQYEKKAEVNRGQKGRKEKREQEGERSNIFLDKNAQKGR